MNVEPIPVASPVLASDLHRMLAVLPGHALRLWHRLCAASPVRPPIIRRLDGGAVAFGWNNPAYYLDVESHPDGTFEWVYIDRAAKHAEGTVNERERELPAAFWERLRAVGA